MSIKNTFKEYKNKGFGVRRWGAKLVIALSLFLIPNMTFALTQQEAQDQINQLNVQNQSAQSQINQLQGQKNTLAGQLSLFDAQISQMQGQINSAQAQIELTSTQIGQTATQITDAESKLQVARAQLGDIISTSYEQSQESSIEVIAKSNNFSDYVNRSTYLESVQVKITDTANQIVALKKSLDQKQKDLEAQRTKAQQLKSDTLSQQSLIGIQRQQKDSLLAQTKGSESSYQSLISSNNARMGVLHCIAAGGCQSVSNGNLVATNTPLYYSQISAQWANYQYDGPGNTIGMYGCLITSLAMYHGVDPVTEAGRHRYSNGYMLGGFGQNVTGNWTAINTALAQGHPVIFGLYLDSYGDTHFVLAKSMADGKYYINDPYFGAGHTYQSSQIYQAVIPY